MNRCLFFVFLATACGYPEGKYWSDLHPRLCERHNECNVNLTVDACLAIPLDVDTSTCDYDADAAELCAVEAELAECLVNEDANTSVFVEPEICDEVWVNCAG
jgi:hypothetical protein